MTNLGQLCLLAAFVTAGFAAFACLAAQGRRDRQILAQAGSWTALLALLALTIVAGVLAWALLVADFRFAYVAQYSNRSMPWHYRLSAFWVGQSGSMLLWTWLSALLAVAYRFWPQTEPGSSRQPAFGVLMGWVCFLTAIMVFAADPMEPSLDARHRRRLQPAPATPGDAHPSADRVPGLRRLDDPLRPGPHRPGTRAFRRGLAGPDALVVAVFLGRLGRRRPDRRRLGLRRTRLGRLLVLGPGGKRLADPLAHRHRHAPRPGRVASPRTAQENGARTRFGDLRALQFRRLSHTERHFQQPSRLQPLADRLGLPGPLGRRWRCRRNSSHPATGRPRGLLRDRRSLFARGGHGAVDPRAGSARRNHAAGHFELAALGSSSRAKPRARRVVLQRGAGAHRPAAAGHHGGVAALAVGRDPGRRRRGLLAFAAGIGVAAGSMAFGAGVRNPIALATAALAAMVPAGLAGQFLLDLTKRRGVPRRLYFLLAGRRPYAGFLAHLGLACLAVGVVGSSFGKRQADFTLHPGQTVAWAGRAIRYVGLRETESPDKLVLEAELSVRPGRGSPYTLLPAQHLYHAGNQWTAEVAIHPTWLADFYAILHGGQRNENVRLTLIENPLMRWIWLSGWIASGAALLGLWPLRRRKAEARAEDRQNRVTLRLPGRRLAAAAALLMSLIGR